MEQEKKKFEQRGLKVAALSYDSSALLAGFAKRRSITYPLLADSASRVIRAFDILNENFPKDHEWSGVPFPGTFIIDEKGVVTAKYFEEDHRDRYTAASILAKSFRTAEGVSWTDVVTPHLRLRYAATDLIVRAGSRIELAIEVELKPGMHVYAPGVQTTYKPIVWTVEPSRAWAVHPATFPKARTLQLPAIGETVPVYEGKMRLSRDLSIGQQSEVRPALAGGGNELVVRGAFRYQACDDRQCFPPATVPLQWTLRYEAHDNQRAPADLQRKAGSGN
ncbi:MAG: redoxin domain-containing protein [Acidobacteria bacterium]|nr:redoxin domain-containing protein [Acidobacteriota bacterium]